MDGRLAVHPFFQHNNQQMIKTTQFNNISDELLATVKLGSNETAIFVNLGNNADPSGIPLYPTQGISPIDSIYDPFRDEWLEVAYITRAITKDDKKAIPLGTITFEAATKGIITLSGNKAGDRALFEYLSLSNHNLSNPNRDKSKKPIFERLIAGEKAARQLKEGRDQLANMKWAFDTPLGELVVALKTRGHDLTSAPEAIVRQKALEEAKNSPFVGTAALSTNGVIEELNVKLPEAFQAGVLKFDANKKMLVNTELGEYYENLDVRQVDKVEAKIAKVMEYCKNNLDFAAKLLEEIR